MNKDHPISFGDFLLASEGLDGGDPATRRRIAALLGFDWRETKTPAASDAPSSPRAASEEGLKVVATDDVKVNADPKPPGEVAAANDDAAAEELWLEPLPPRAVRMPVWVSEVKPMPKPVGVEEDEPLPSEPLFTPAWTRALLATTLSYLDERGPLDIERVVKLLSLGEPLKHLPRRMKLGLKPNLQLLIDINKTMMPFVQDQFLIVSEMERLIPAQSITQLFFSACPLRGVGSGEDWPEEPYRPPHTDTPVLLLTDLGVGRAGPGVESASVEEWLRFARVVRAAGCQLAALVPYPLRRVAAPLRRAMSVIPWDRATTTGQVRRIRLADR
ncbi:MAG: hypothetical protein QOJ70_2242 [Acidobacteriota bacterium]|jgi:hypothetical protein|nr:hypothetical protein [Acidobacteriota bacterium]